MSTLIAGFDTRRITADELALVPTPEATDTHQPIPHIAIANEVIQGLGMRGFEVKTQEYAVSPDGMRMFGLITSTMEFEGVNFAVGLRNANDKSMKLGLCAGFRVLICSNLAFMGEFQGLMAKHTSRFNLEEACDIALGRIHRGVNDMKTSIQRLKDFEIPDSVARNAIYDAFVSSNGWKLPSMIMRSVHDLYFDPIYDEFKPRTAYSLHNSFTSAFKELKPIRQFQETAKLTPFITEAVGIN